jgi:nitroreductase
MDLFRAIHQRRSVRRFQKKPVSVEVLKKCVEAARVAPSAKNLQPFEYLVVTDQVLCDQVFATIGWAGYLTPTWTPAVSERPPAYIVMLVHESLNQFYKWDSGLAAAHIMLTAEAEGLGSCMLLKVNRSRLQEVFSLPANVSVDAVIALGFKAEHPVIEEYEGKVEYWNYDNDVLHFPKRSLDAIFHLNKFK